MMSVRAVSNRRHSSAKKAAFEQQKKLKAATYLDVKARAKAAREGKIYSA